MNFMVGDDDSSNPLDLNVIRRTLIRLEETIIFSFIERAQFALNPRMYTTNGFAQVLHKNGFNGSWLEWFLFETEKSHGKRVVIIIPNYDL
jgi:chorismate mutase